MSVVTGSQPRRRPAAAAGPRCRRPPRAHRSWTIIIGMAIVGTLLPVLAYIPPFTLAPAQQRLDRRLHQRRRVRAARPRPQPGRRRRRPAGPRLRGVLRHRRLHVRVRRVAVRQRASSASRSSRRLGDDAGGLLFWPMLLVGALVAATFGILLGAPTLRLRGDYLAIVTLGFGEIVPIVFLNSDAVTNGTNGIGGLLRPALPGHRLVLGRQPVAVLRDDAGPHHGRHDPLLPAGGEPARAGPGRRSARTSWRRRPTASTPSPRSCSPSRSARRPPASPACSTRRSS